MQQMEPGNTYREQPTPEYGAYEGSQQVNQPPAYGGPQPLPQGSVYFERDKIQADTSARATAGQRLCLAIVSVVMIAGGAIATATDTTASLGSYIIIAIAAFVIFLINAAFNRWWFS